MEEPVIKPSAHAIIDYIKHIEEVCRGQDLRQQGSWSFRTLPGDMLWVSSARTHVKALEDNQVHASFHRWKAGVQRERERERVGEKTHTLESLSYRMSVL